MRRSASILTLVLGLTLFAYNAARLGIDGSEIRRAQADQERFGALENLIESENSAIAAENDLVILNSPSPRDLKRTAALDRRVQAVQLRQEALSALGSHSSKLEAFKLTEIYTRRRIADLRMQLGLVLLASGIALSPGRRLRAIAENEPVL